MKKKLPYSNAPKKISLPALQTRLNACWFSGKANTEQKNCIFGFSMLYLLYNDLFENPIPKSWLSYILATTYHETAFTMCPIREYGLGNGRPYGNPDPITGEVYYGRGYVQLTWKDNYVKAESVIKDIITQEHIHFVTEPDLALRPIYAAQIAIHGMSNGWFTGKKLGDYLTEQQTDYVNARRIINGTDKAELIASYAISAQSAISLAQGEGISRNNICTGSQGDDVREVQLVLNQNPDGIFGSKTKDALIKFQKEQGLVADGVCGIITWNSIDKYFYGIEYR